MSLVRWTGLALLLGATGLVCVAIGAPGSERGSQSIPPVDLFDAMRDDQVEVQLIPKSVEQAMVIVRNRTDKPLRIRLPEAFAGVPVLAQRDNAGGGGNNRGGGGGGNAGNQGFGGGMGGMGGMGMGMGMGGMFNVGPQRVGKLKVATVCLEHGKEDPNPRVAYELKPIESFTQNPALIELCKMLGRGEMGQVAAQAAAWHLSDDLSWDELARKVKVKHLNGTQELYFSGQQLKQAMQAVQRALHRTESESTPTDDSTVSPGEQFSQR